jgi:hypothetical protein
VVGNAGEEAPLPPLGVGAVLVDRCSMTAAQGTMYFLCVPTYFTYLLINLFSVAITK